MYRTSAQAVTIPKHPRLSWRCRFGFHLWVNVPDTLPVAPKSKLGLLGVEELLVYDDRVECARCMLSIEQGLLSLSDVCRLARDWGQYPSLDEWIEAHRAGSVTVQPKLAVRV